MTTHGRKKRSSKESQVVSMSTLLKDMDKLRWDHPITMKALKVAKQLQKWVDARGQLFKDYECPFVAVVVSEVIVSITIGDFCVWESESVDEECLTLELCKAAYIEEVMRLYAFIEK